VTLQAARSRGRFIARLIPALLSCAGPSPASASDPPLQINQYAHTAWTARDGALLGFVFAMAQTPDGYLWVAGSFGLFRFDGLRFVPWQPPKGQSLPSGPYSLLVSRDGTLWIGTFEDLVSWNEVQLTRHPAANKEFVTSLLEDRDGTIWAGLLADRGRLCAFRAGVARCSAPEDGFGAFVWSLGEDSSGTLWAGADSGVWRWKPGLPQRVAMPGMRVGDLSTTADGHVLVGVRGGGLRQLVDGRAVPYPIRRAAPPDDVISDRDLKANKLLRDRDGGLWIGTEGLGIVHVMEGRADSFTRADGLSGNIASLEQRNNRTGMVQRFTQITFEMVDLERGTIVWSNSYDIARASADDIIYR